MIVCFLGQTGARAAVPKAAALFSRIQTIFSASTLSPVNEKADYFDSR
jgi:hypothetical protein